MHSFKARPYTIVGPIQNYAWGTRNDQAFIPKFLGRKIEPDTPYAELWIGAHPKAPAMVLMDDDSMPFDAFIVRYPDEILGSRILRKIGPRLPFLLKVLSAAEALSIQAHPNKAQAEVLHARDPEHYPDDNHKPEIAIALTELTALAGFKSLSQLISTLEAYPEIARFIGGGIVSNMKRGLTSSSTPELQGSLVKEMYATLLRKSQSHKSQLLQAIESLSKRRGEHRETWTETEAFFFELRESYPEADSGLFSLFLLNLIHLRKGQGLFLSSGIPHAYLRGNIVECMANSDNVVRAGLTPKFQDVDTLVDILTYETGPVAIQEGVFMDGEVLYQTPVSEFRIARLDLQRSDRLARSITTAQIMLVTEGEIRIDWNDEREVYIKGQSMLLPAALRQCGMSAEVTGTVFVVSIPE